MLETSIAEVDRHIDLRRQRALVALAGDQADIHFRVQLVKALQTRHQPVSGKGKIGGHLQHLMLLLRGDRQQPSIQALQAILHITLQQLTGIGQGNPTVNPIKQTNS